MAVTIYTDKCKGISSCTRNGLCIQVCALDAIENVDDMPKIDEVSCTGCGLCVMNCPEGALSK